MIEKILERLEEEKEAYSDTTYYVYGVEAAIKIVQEVAKEYSKDTNVRSNGWIPCSEQMPENDLEDVLVWFEYFRYGNYQRLYQTRGISYTFHGEWSRFVNGTSGWRDLRVIAWQPLPAPYQKGE